MQHRVARCVHDKETESGRSAASRGIARWRRSTPFRHSPILRCAGTDRPARFGADVHPGIGSSRARCGCHVGRTPHPSSGRCIGSGPVRRGLPRQHQPRMEVRTQLQDVTGLEGRHGRSSPPADPTGHRGSESSSTGTVVSMSSATDRPSSSAAKAVASGSFSGEMVRPLRT